MEDTVERIRAGWSVAVMNSERMSRVFYGNLFRLDPSTKPLFVGDLALQGRKLTQTLSFIVDHLDEPDILMPAATDLAIRHVEYGVVAEQYQAVGQALVETLKQMLGQDFSEDDQTAWSETYRTLSVAMIDAAYPS